MKDPGHPCYCYNGEWCGYRRVLQKEVPVDRILALHRDIVIGKDDLSNKRDAWWLDKLTLFPLVGSNWLKPSVAKPSPLMLTVPPP